MLDLPRLGAIAFLIIWVLCAANHYREELKYIQEDRDPILICVVIGLGYAVLVSAVCLMAVLISYIAAGGFS